MKVTEEGAFQILNLPQKSVLSSSSKTKFRSTTAIQKRKECVIFQEISPQPSLCTVTLKTSRSV